MGPDAYRTAGIVDALSSLGHRVTDSGNLAPDSVAADSVSSPNSSIHGLAETIGWTRALKRTAEALPADTLPVFMGGDHALSLGSVAGMANVAHAADAPQFVLWLDAHSDFHTPATTDSGHLHGTPVAYITGQRGFENFPELETTVPTENICMIGLRSVDAAEKAALEALDVDLADMRLIDEYGIKKPLEAFLDRVAAANGRLHVSLDVDFLDPSIAPAVGTTVPGGATVREAHLTMELLHDSGLVTSLDLVELNPFLDDRGKTASLMVDLTASLLGRRIFDRPTRSFA